MRKRVVKHIGTNELVGALKAGSDQGPVQLRLAYADKMQALMGQYLIDKQLSKAVVDDALQKAWQERGLQKDRYDFRSLIMAIAGTAIPDGEQPSSGQAPTVHIETANADQHENLLEDFQQCIKDAVKQVPSGLRHVFLPPGSGPATGDKSATSRAPLKQYREGAAETIRKQLNRHPGFAIMLLLMAITY